MSDIVQKRNTALQQLLEEFDRPPPVPPKDGRRNISLSKSGISETLATPGLPSNIWAVVDKQPSVVPKHERTRVDSGIEAIEAVHFGPSDRNSDMNSTSHGERRGGIGFDNAKEGQMASEPETTRVVTVKRKKVAFAIHDLSPPPVSLQKESFADEIGNFELNATNSVFDPPPAPRLSRFPDQLPEVTKRKPAPLNLSRPTSQSGKWKVRHESEIWTPIEDEPDTASIISMDVRNAPKICPLPYKPIKSVPLRARGSLRPAPLRVRKGVRFDSLKSPACLPLKSPAPFAMGKQVRFADVKSPAVANFRTPATPFSSSEFTILTPRRKQGVRFAAAKSPATSNFKVPPTPYHQQTFRLAKSSARRNVRFDSIKSPARSKFKIPPTPFFDESFQASDDNRNVRFADVKSPASSTFKTPPTPYYDDSFPDSDPEKTVRFDEVKSPAASSFKTPSTPYYNDSFTDLEPEKSVRFLDLKSPAASNFKTPPTPYYKASFRQSTSPPDRSPVTPRAMHMTHPAIEPESPLEFEDGERFASQTMDDLEIQRAKMDAYGVQHPPRTTSLQHRRHASVPDNMKAAEETKVQILPSTTFDEGAVGESTLRWLGMLPKQPSYRVSEQERTSSDRNQILGSYFHRPTPSF